MNRRSMFYLGGMLLIALIVSAFAWHQHRQHQYRMVNVGGDTNKCECSKRLER